MDPTPNRRGLRLSRHFLVRLFSREPISGGGGSHVQSPRAPSVAQVPTGAPKARSLGKSYRCIGGAFGTIRHTRGVCARNQCASLSEQPNRLFGLPAGFAVGTAHWLGDDRVGPQTHPTRATQKIRSRLAADQCRQNRKSARASGYWPMAQPLELITHF